jgi:hypothetical protein
LGIVGTWSRWWRVHRQDPVCVANSLRTPVALCDANTGTDSGLVSCSSTGRANTEDGPTPSNAINHESSREGEQTPGFPRNVPDVHVMPAEPGTREQAMPRVVQGSQDLSTIRELTLAPSESVANEHLRRGWELLLIGRAGNGAKYILGFREVPAGSPKAVVDEEDSWDD